MGRLVVHLSVLSLSGCLWGLCSVQRDKWVKQHFSILISQDFSLTWGLPARSLLIKFFFHILRYKLIRFSPFQSLTHFLTFFHFKSQSFHIPPKKKEENTHRKTKADPIPSVAFKSFISKEIQPSSSDTVSLSLPHTHTFSKKQGWCNSRSRQYQLLFPVILDKFSSFYHHQLNHILIMRYDYFNI